MIDPPKKSLLALEAVLFIATHARAEPINSRELSNQLGFPSRYLEQLMQKLVRANILRGVRGPRGGYVLARERRKIAIGEIFDALHEPTPSEDLFCSEIGNALIRPVWESATLQFQNALNRVTLEELASQAENTPASAPPQPEQFMI